MEPATLYMLYKLADGTEHLYKGHFGSPDLCETSRDRMTEQPSPRVTILKSVCWEHGTWAPDWIAEKHINGAPIDPKYRPDHHWSLG
ncbi:hypothetical protein [Hyphomicrobium sp.]|uniref:hypothetical protein n=1 Tax=Hyphomicrobium sp. TaxID=82 RepID=UPI003F7043F5